MPIEIRELIFKATVAQEVAQGKKPMPSSNNEVSPNDAIINICVEKVLEILKEKHER